MSTLITETVNEKEVEALYQRALVSYDNLLDELGSVYYALACGPALTKKGEKALDKISDVKGLIEIASGMAPGKLPKKIFA